MLQNWEFEFQHNIPIVIVCISKLYFGPRELHYHILSLIQKSVETTEIMICFFKQFLFK